MATTKFSLGSTTSLTATIDSLASGSARESTAVDNTSNLFLDALVYLAIQLAAGSPTGDKRINVYVYGSVDGSNYTDNATGVDAALTLRSPTNLIFLGSIECPDSGALTYKGVFGSIAAAFAGVLPPKWGIVIENQTGLAFAASGHTKQYRGMHAQTV